MVVLNHLIISWWLPSWYLLWLCDFTNWEWWDIRGFVLIFWNQWTVVICSFLLYVILFLMNMFCSLLCCCCWDTAWILWSVRFNLPMMLRTLIQDYNLLIAIVHTGLVTFRRSITILERMLEEGVAIWRIISTTYHHFKFFLFFHTLNFELLSIFVFLFFFFDLILKQLIIVLVLQKEWVFVIILLVFVVIPFACVIVVILWSLLLKRILVGNLVHIRRPSIISLILSHRLRLLLLQPTIKTSMVT